MPVVVSDTSPVRALHHVGLVALLRDYFGEVLIPPAVAEELRTPGPRFQPIEPAALPGFRIQGPADVGRVRDLRRVLDVGESEALVLALEVGATVVLIDELAAREVARDLGLVPTGALGVLLQARRDGVIPQLAPLIDDLRSRLGFFVSDALRDDLLRRVGELP